LDSAEHDRDMAEPEDNAMLSGEAVILRLLGPSKHMKPIQIELLKHVKENVVKLTLCAVIYSQLIVRLI